MNQTTAHDLSGKEIWETLLKHPEFASQPPKMREVMQPFVEALPTVLRNNLDHIVTLETVMKAKYTFLRYCIENGLVGKLVEALPDMFDGLEGSLTAALSGALDMAESIAQDVPGMLEEYGLTERQVFLNPSVGMTGEALDLYDQGKLTIRELLRLQPSIIVKNT